MKKHYYTNYYPSPVGILKIVFSVSAVHRISFCQQKVNGIDCKCFYQSKEIRDTYNLIYDQLNEYFTGQRQTFHLPFELEGSDFQQDVWSYLRKIPYGEVRTYSEVARGIGSKNAVRAVGNACRNNPLLIMIPCHRVIKSNGDTGSYVGKVYRKRWLLGHEQKYSSSDFSSSRFSKSNFQQRSN